MIEQDWYIVQIEQDDVDFTRINNVASKHAMSVWTPTSSIDKQQMYSGYFFVSDYSKNFENEINRYGTTAKYILINSKPVTLTPEEQQTIRQLEALKASTGSLKDRMDDVNDRIQILSHKKRTQSNVNTLRRLIKRRKKLRMKYRNMVKGTKLKNGMLITLNSKYVKYRCKVKRIKKDTVDIQLLLKSRKLNLTCPREIFERYVKT